MRFNKKFSTLIAVAAIATMAMPGLAFASNGKDKDDDRNEQKQERRENNREHRSEQTNDLGVRVFEDRGLHLGIPGLFYKGKVTAVSSTGFTMIIRDNSSLTVDASSAKIIRVPRTVIGLADIKVNDSVWVTGTKVNSTITASVIYNMSENVRPAKTKGNVTAVNGNTITVQTKNDKTITVNTTGDTSVVKQDGTLGTTGDVQVGSSLKLWGLWDKVANLFSALRIKIK